MAEGDVTKVTISAGGKSVELKPRQGRGAVDIEKQLELDGMPEKKAPREKQYDPYTEAFELTPFLPAPEVEAVASELIPDYHAPRWKAPPTIIYLFSQKAPKAQGEEAIATCRKVGGVQAYLYRLLFATSTCRNADEYNQKRYQAQYEAIPNWKLPEGKHVVEDTPLFVITWHLDWWNMADEMVRKAITDHELQHIGVDYNSRGDGLRYYLLPHTIQEFHIIAERWGPYAADLAMFEEAIKKGKERRGTNALASGGKR